MPPQVMLWRPEQYKLCSKNMQAVVA
jgi:hypothetical protein